MRAFTLIEVMIVAATVIVFFTLATPVTLQFLDSQTLISERDNIVGILKRARSRAFAYQNATSHGVYLASTSTILFQGTSYESRNKIYDEIFKYSGRLTASGTLEIVFSPFRATTSSSTIILTRGLYSRDIRVNKEGGIFW